MRVFVATKNAGKLRELQAIFAPYGWSLEAFGGYADVVEGESSYADNAARKARALHAQLRAAGVEAGALGDDSGLEVTALGGRPGVLSARYGRAGATWPERRQGLLQEVARRGSDRAARFVCALDFVAGDGLELTALGEIAGTIALEERGRGGYSYDPIFEYSDGRTFAELSEGEKNAVSHRARAARSLVAAVRAARR